MHLFRPVESQLQPLCQRLRQHSIELDLHPAWPAEQLRLCGDHGVMAWFVDPIHGGLGCTKVDIVDGLLVLGQACLTTTFILTQQIAAYHRIAASANRAIADEILPEVASARRSATVGISHLTTSRQHLDRPALSATEVDDGFILNGYSPWVTGAGYVDDLVTGGQLPDGSQIVVCIPFDTPGITVGTSAQLVALSGSCTASVAFDRVYVPRSRLLEGPRPNVIQTNSGGSTGGLQTSTLALALALAACDYLQTESVNRHELSRVAVKFAMDLREQVERLRALANDPKDGSLEQLRERCNSLVLRTTQAALSAAKGAGFVRGHPVGRWCQEALFFLVWSCPQSVVEANLCEWAGV